MRASTQVNRGPLTPAAQGSAWERVLGLAAGVPMPEWERVSSQVSVSHIAKGKAIFEQEVAHPYLYAVSRGIVKLAYLDSDGAEWIKSFICEGQFFASIAALQKGGTTTFGASAIEDCTVERISYLVMAQMADKHLAWARAAQALTLSFGARKEQRERELLTLTPEKRYRLFIAQSPGLAKRIPQKDLARHLGLSPVGLNRIAVRVRRELEPTENTG
jgi:CRP-like cAMP-binding protein